jgi:diguanylate cyclase (GGDEF)-like protein
MNMGWSESERAVLHGLLADGAGDIVVRLNAQGFIEQGSDSLNTLGVDLAQMLLPPHVAELADSRHAGDVSRHFEAVMRDANPPGWIEFRAKICGLASDCIHSDCARWYALSLRRLVDDHSQVLGAIGLLRSIERVRNLEQELSATVLIDPVTGLVNRQVFLAQLDAELRTKTDSLIVLLAVDRMRALFMQYGQRAADEINWGFAKFLQAMALPGSELAQIDGERFAVILSGMNVDAARAWSDDVLRTFSSLALPASGKTPRLTASAGLARITTSVDWTMQQAELALIMARAGGGNRLAQTGMPGPSYLGSGSGFAAVPNDPLGERPLHR